MTERLAGFVEAHSRAMLLLVLSFSLAGILFMFRLPVSIFPQTDFPRIVILVDNGIAPVDVQMLTVTRPIEQAIRIVPGITDVRSTTARGSTEISVFFRWDVDILNAMHLVQGVHHAVGNDDAGCDHGQHDRQRHDREALQGLGAGLNGFFA